jgi:hypothetical protein
MSQVNFDKIKLAYDACMGQDQIKGPIVSPVQRMFRELNIRSLLKVTDGIDARRELTDT